MNNYIKESMFSYYDERADEYDELYTFGGGPASITDRNIYKQEVIKIKKSISKQNITGILYDVPCGTAFWMPSYYKNTNQIILIDQSLNMLEKAKERSKSLGCFHKCNFNKLNAFDLNTLKLTPSVLLIGFFLSHLNIREEIRFFSIIKNILYKHGKIIILDSTWSDERAKTRDKEGSQSRKLNNGTEFKIYKKYFTINDIKNIGERELFNVKIEFFGKAFFSAVLYT